MNAEKQLKMQDLIPTIMIFKEISLMKQERKIQPSQFIKTFLDFVENRIITLTLKQ